MKNRFGILIGLLCWSLLGSTSSAQNAVPVKNNEIQFVTVPGSQKLPTFQMAETEITNEQYAHFLNEALKTNHIQYNGEQGMVYNLQGQPMIWLGGSRVVKDHNRDGIYELDEMENPLNRSYIEFNSQSDRFEVVDPAKVNWSKYFDKQVYPNVVDKLSHWAELNEEGTGFYGEGDTDKTLPTLSEVKKWPVTFIRYYGAEGFAKFYGYDLPTKAQ